MMLLFLIEFFFISTTLFTISSNAQIDFGTLTDEQKAALAGYLQGSDPHLAEDAINALEGIIGSGGGGGGGAGGFGNLNLKNLSALFDHIEHTWVYVEGDHDFPGDPIHFNLSVEVEGHDGEEDDDGYDLQHRIEFHMEVNETYHRFFRPLDGDVEVQLKAEADEIFHLNASQAKERYSLEMIHFLNVTSELQQNCSTDSQRYWRNSLDFVDFSQVKLEGSVCNDDTLSLQLNFQQLKQIRLEHQVNSLNMTLDELKCFEKNLNQQICTGKMVALQNVIDAATSPQVLEKRPSIKANLEAYLSRLAELKVPMEDIRDAIDNATKKLNDVQVEAAVAAATAGVIVSVEDAKKHIEQHFDDLNAKVDMDMKLCHDSVNNVSFVVHHGRDNDTDYKLVVNVDLNSEDDLEGIKVILKASLAAHLQLSLDDLDVSQVQGRKRTLTQWLVSMKQSVLSVDLQSQYQNVTLDVTLPSLDDQDIQCITNHSIRDALQWIKETKALTEQQLQARLKDLLDLQNTLTASVRNAEPEFNSTVSSFHDQVVSYCQQAKSFINSFVRREDSDKQGGAQTDDEDIVTAIAKHKIDRCNNTFKSLEFQKDQIHLKVDKALLVVFDVKIRLIKFYLSLLNSTQNLTLSNWIDALEKQLEDNWRLKDLQNVTLNRTEDLVRHWYDRVNETLHDIKENEQVVSRKSWKLVSDIKSYWRTKKDQLQSDIDNSIEDFLNCTVQNSDYNDIDSSSSGITLKWQLEFPQTVSKDDVVSMIQNLLFAESAVKKSDISVDVTITPKRSTSVSATANMDSSSSSSPSSAGTNVDYIIGGVVGGVVLLVIIILVVVLIRRKHSEKV